MNRIILFLVLFLTFSWILHTLSKNFITDPTFSEFIARKDQILPNVSLWTWMIRIHILLAVIALLTGPLGIIKKIRNKSLSFHRWNGRVYVLSIILNFIPGVYVSFFATGGLLSTIGFLILNSLWLGTTILGIKYIKRKNIILHSQWLIRSFFLSFANTTIYITVTIFQHFMNITYVTSYTLAVWICWALNLLIAEFLIRKKYFN